MVRELHMVFFLFIAHESSGMWNLIIAKIISTESRDSYLAGTAVIFG
jgi:hypothetical protein